jgi:hypothetical protein
MRRWRRSTTPASDLGLVKSLHPSLALALACSLSACAGGTDNSVDNGSSATGLDTAKVGLARAQLVAACRDTAARKNPTVRWVADTALASDLNYDGAPELVIWGTEADSLFVVAIVGCSGILPGHMWIFPLNALEDFGTKNLDVALTDPALGQSYLDENCIRTDTTAECQHLRKIEPELEAASSRGAHGLSIGIVGRDHVHVYWDPDTGGFVSWRP